MAAGRPIAAGREDRRLENWVGGRETWKSGEWEAERPSHRQEGQVWVGGWEAWKLSCRQEDRQLGWKPGGWGCRQGGREAGGAGREAERLPALSVVLKRGPAWGTVLGTAPPHGTPVGTSRAAWATVPGKATHDLTACWRTADMKHTHPQPLASLQTRLPTAPGENKPLALTGSLVNIPRCLVSNIIHSSSLHKYK